MPAALELRLERVGQEVIVGYGGRALACYEVGDRGMRNVAVVALTRAGIPGVQVGELFGIRPEHVSRLRRLASEGGTAALTPPTGRPPKLDRAARQRAFALADQGLAGSEIARRLGVSQPTISRLLAARPAPENERLPLTEAQIAQIAQAAEVADLAPAGGVAGPAETHATTEVAAMADLAPAGGVKALAGEVVDGEVGPRIAIGGGQCAYAGAMLLYPFLERVDAGAVFSACAGGPGRRYDQVAVVLASTFAFALGSSSLEGCKHLLARDAGLLIGADRFPHLRTLRPRLADLADEVDPIAVQVALAKGMLDADRQPPRVFYVDEHFVAYSGARPVGKGWNTRRRHAQPGRHETVIVDDRWRAICFASGPPSSLGVGMRGPIAALREICGERRVMIGFDRGGAFPSVFSELREAGMDWITYRRAPLQTPTAAPTTVIVTRDGRSHELLLADEQIALEGYGTARQISLYEHDRMALQILTGALAPKAGTLTHVLRGRWCIENTFKYLENHNGLHWLCDYHMTIAPDESLVRNPARTSALDALHDSERRQAELQRAIGAHLTTTNPTPDEQTLIAIAQDALTAAQQDVATATTALKPIPAKVPANTLDPDAKRATGRTHRRALQTICRLLAYNAELDLARALDRYLQDPDEYRALTRHLLHQPGSIHYTPDRVTVTIQRPDAPRIARALTLLIDEINTTPPQLPHDPRPITYALTP